MQQQTYIRAIHTPDIIENEEGGTPAPDKAVSVTIVDYLVTSYGGIAVIFVDEKGNLRRGRLSQFSNCVFVTQ